MERFDYQRQPDDEERQQTAAPQVSTEGIRGSAESNAAPAESAPSARCVVVPHEDTNLFDWAETHPEKTMQALTSWWGISGRGCREIRFEFRNIIRSAKRDSERSKP